MVYKKKKDYIESRKWYRYHFFGKAEITVLEDKTIIDASVANISFAGIGLYSPVPTGKGKKVKIKISFIDNNGKVRKDFTEGKVDWLSKLGNTYLMGIFFDEELNIINQPILVKHLAWLTNTYNLPQPYTDKRISLL
jgi:hypothetical protein